MLKISKSLITQIESGYGMFSLKVILRVAKIFSISLDELFYSDISKKYTLNLNIE